MPPDMTARLLTEHYRLVLIDPHTHSNPHAPASRPLDDSTGDYDYTDEVDCARKVRLLSTLARLTTAIFANSPLYMGQPTGIMRYLCHTWTRTGTERSGFPRPRRSHRTGGRWTPSGHWTLDGRTLETRMRTGRPSSRWASGHPGDHDAARTANRVAVGGTRGTRRA